MTFIKYTSDGKAVIQPAALTLSGLDREETLELHTLENAIVLLKQEMEPAEKAAATTTLLRLAHSLMEDMLADWEAQEDDGDMCDGCHGCDEDMLPIPAEAFADAGILYDNVNAGGKIFLCHVLFLPCSLDSLSNCSCIHPATASFRTRFCSKE